MSDLGNVARLAELIGDAKIVVMLICFPESTVSTHVRQDQPVG